MDLNAFVEIQKFVHETNGLNSLDKNYKFYFDETNNVRKFLLNPSNESKVNSKDALSSDFILGGVCFENTPNCDKLFGYFSNQGIVGELKSKHLFRYKNYQDNFGNERVTTLLKWFEDNPDVYLHYAIENNFYFALVDIVDSLLLLKEYQHMTDYIFALKDALYRVCMLYQQEVLDLLCYYGFPDIPKDSMQEFARKISDIIDDADIRDDFFAETLRQMLRTVKNTTEMSFIVDNKPFVLQDNYAQIYLNRMADFIDSDLVFDEEREVLKRINKWSDLSKWNNISFVDSTTDKFIQISDCIIACLSKTIKFLDENDNRSLSKLEISNSLKNNFRQLKSLIDRSDNKNRLLILNLNAQSLTRERYIKLSFICGT